MGHSRAGLTGMLVLEVMPESLGIVTSGIGNKEVFLMVGFTVSGWHQKNAVKVSNPLLFLLSS